MKITSFKHLCVCFMLSPAIALSQISGPESTPTDYFRTIASGNWNNAGIWEQSSDSITWTSASAFPTYTDGRVFIQSLHTITITASITIDQLTVEQGAVLVYADHSGSTVTVNDGSGTDLMINGEFDDSGPNSIAWNGFATWSLGSSGILLRTRSTSSNNWRDAYEGGIGNVPATAKWVLRKTSADPPSLTGTSMTYPNLIIENISGSAWTMGVGSVFSGASARPVIKGNLDIGGSGTDPVDLLNSNTNISPVLVQGNMIVRSGCTARNYGTGFEVQGDLTVNGSVNYSAGNGARKLVFSGTSSQVVDGAGTLNIYDLVIDKSSNGLTLNRAVTTDHALTFTHGLIYSSSINILTVGTNASASGASNASYVNGPVRYTGLNAFTFPAGKNGDYQPLAVSSSVSGTVDLTCEYFHTDPRPAFNNALGPGLHHISGCEYWMLTQNAGSISKNISLSWDGNSCGVNAPADLRVAHWDGAQWNDEGNTAIVQNNSYSGSVTSGVVTSFSPFTLASASDNNILPVEVVGFNAAYSGKEVFVKWSTGSEHGSDHFEVERSPDGIVFNTIAEIAAAGNSSGEIHYAAADAAPLYGISFYRLVQVDRDGKETVYPPAAVDAGSDDKLAIENIFSGDQQIEIIIRGACCAAIACEIADITGRVIYSKQFSPEEDRVRFSVPSEDFLQGMYFLKVRTGTGIRVKKFML